MANMDVRHWITMITELRRYPAMSYKAEITVLSGLDEGDMKAIDKCFRNIDLSCQLDKEDGRFVLKGAAFNPMSILNTLTELRGYKVEFNPQQHNIPLKHGNVDDKFAFIYHLSKPVKTSSEPEPPPRGDSLPNTDSKPTKTAQELKKDFIMGE